MPLSPDVDFKLGHYQNSVAAIPNVERWNDRRRRDNGRNHLAMGRLKVPAGTPHSETVISLSVFFINAPLGHYRLALARRRGRALNEGEILSPVRRRNSVPGIQRSLTVAARNERSAAPVKSLFRKGPDGKEPELKADDQFGPRRRG